MGWTDKSGAAHRSITLRPQKNMTSTMATWFITTHVLGLMPPVVEFQGNVSGFAKEPDVCSAATFAPAAGQQVVRRYHRVPVQLTCLQHVLVMQFRVQNGVMPYIRLQLSI